MPGTAPRRLRREARARRTPRPSAQLLCVASLVPRKGHALLRRGAASSARAAVAPHLRGQPRSGSPDGAGGARPRQRAGLRDADRLPGDRCRSADLARTTTPPTCSCCRPSTKATAWPWPKRSPAGLPVVGTRTGGLPELVDERNGVLVPPGDLEALTLALGDVIGDDARRERLAAGARARAADLPTWPQAAAAMESALLGARLAWRPSALTGSPCASPPTRPRDPSR